MCDRRVVVCFGDYAEEEVEMIVSGRGEWLFRGHF